jgi:hypothetical protein
MLNQVEFKFLTSKIRKFAQGYAIYMSCQIFFDHCENKVNCTHVQALRLCTGTTVYRGSRERYNSTLS